MKRLVYVFYIIFVVIFTVGVVSALLGRVICTHENQNYSELQPESFLPDMIETVLGDESLGQIYVCYNDANCVNVYSESGEFLWAVATPYIRNSYFELQDGKLIIYGDGAYIYDSADGKFLGFENEEDLDLNYMYENKPAGELQDGEIYFDSYQVYKADSEGKLKTVVSRPWWHYLFNVGCSLTVGFIGAIGIGLTVCADKTYDYKRAKNKDLKKNRKAKIIIGYFRITSVVHVVYTVANIICGFFGGFLCIGILPLGIHFIISNWILWNMSDSLRMNNDEQAVLDFWKTAETATFVAAFLSVAAVAIMAAN